MKLIIVLSVIAYGYAAKLDRTYLPPSNAATAGGSPGALAAPDTGFGQDLPNLSAGPVGSRPSSFDQNSGIPNIPSGTGNIQASGNGQASGTFQGTNAPGFNSNIGAQKPSFGQGFNNLESSPQTSRTPFGQTPQSNGQGFAQAEFKPERAQAAADRSAEILKYINENNGDSYEYSYETSNGISAEESGVATNGVRAQGGYSYTGDDGKSYSITYTADENGYQPQGEHLPTPHPIPEEILKSIEENARAAASGTQEGAYRPEEYESDSSPQQYGTGATNYNQPQRPIMAQQSQSSSFNQDQSPQRLSTQGSFNANQFNQQKSDQAPNQFSGSRAQPQNQYSQGIGSTDTVSYSESSGQYNQPQRFSQGSNNVFGTQPGQSTQKSQGQNGRGVGGNGYNYNKPTQGSNQPQQGQSQKLSQGFEDLSGQRASQPTSQFNQQQRPIQGSNIPFGNQMRPSNQYSQGQASQDQKASGYNYNRPQKPTQDFNQFSGQRNQPGQTQQFSPSFDISSKGLSSQPTGQSASQPNQQQRPFQSSNTQFGSQQGPQQYSQGQVGQGKKENGYNYNQPQSSAQGSRFPGPQQSTNKGAFGQQGGQPTAELNQPQRPLQGSNNIFGKQQESPKQYSQGQRGQDQGGNGYNYNQPQKPSQGSNQLSEFEQPQEFSQAGQSNNQFGRPQRPLQGSQSAGLGSQQGQSNQYSLGPKGQDQDENGYYYNRPQSSGSAPISQGPFGQNRPQSSAQGQPGFPARPTSNYELNAIDSKNQGLRPGQQAFSNINTQSGSPTQGTQYSPETNKPSFGSPSITTPSANYSPGSGGNVDGSRPNERYQPSLAAASKFQPQPSISQNKPASSSFGSPSLSQNAPSQALAQGYQYGPGQSSNQSQRPGFDSVNQGFNGAPGANKGTPAGSEFGGPRQPPSFSPEEGYRY